MMPKVQCVFCFENCTTEGRGGEKEGKFQNKAHRTFDIRNTLSPVQGNGPPRGTHILDTFVKCSAGRAGGLLLWLPSWISIDVNKMYRPARSRVTPEEGSSTDIGMMVLYIGHF